VTSVPQTIIFRYTVKILRDLNDRNKVDYAIGPPFPVHCSGNMLLRMYKLHEENVAEHLDA